MHIPDGYLSPSTSLALYAGAAPFWCVALKRVKKELDTQTIPLLSVFSAFSFVVMMFNLPLPGGTTGHAVGMGIAAIVLGPWVSILAISIALFIQALFFGDGGITTLGANCFNMAVVGSLAAFAVYRAIAYGSALTGPRRVFAAAVAGYIGINASALCAAIEFGIQPLLFRDASGAPLYAPYPLSVSIPAMMAGHLTFAGLAELLLSAGVVRYLQRADPAMLKRTAPEIASAPLPAPPARTTKKLWIALAVLVLLTPLGILAIGTAWGEWRALDFEDANARQAMAAASHDHAAPSHAPMGLERLSSLWKAPVADYAPAFVHNAHLGYALSAAAGVVLIVLLSMLITRLLVAARTGRRRTGFIESTVKGLLRATQDALFAEDVARSKGLLQAIDPRVKLLSFAALIASVISVRRIWVVLALFAAAVVLAIASHVPLRLLAGRVWIAVLAFTGVIAFPAIFLTPGQILLRVPLLQWPVTLQGVNSAAMLTMRAETAATLSLLLVLTTLWNRLLRALRFFRLPVIAVVIVETTYRFVFLLLHTAQNMLESRQTRLVGRLRPAEQRRFAASSIGVLLDKSLQSSVDVHTAMQARGFRGQALLLEDLKMGAGDWLQLAALLSAAILAIGLGR
jgi:cobalt/nickel transport system permease protein